MICKSLKLTYGAINMQKFLKFLMDVLVTPAVITLLAAVILIITCDLFNNHPENQTNSYIVQPDFLILSGLVFSFAWLNTVMGYYQTKK